jgi:imidazolonepropionase-like amidohydrolase
MKYVIRKANVITMADESVLRGYDVLVADGKIAAVSRDIDAGACPEIQTRGRYLLPGLFDTHVHLNTSDLIPLLFANGVTTVRNMWGFPQTLLWKRAIAAGKMVGPNIYTTGPLTDGETFWQGCERVMTAREAEASVRRVVEAGYDYVKTLAAIPRDAFMRLMGAARAAGIRVVGHGNAQVSADELIALGYYSIEHAGCLPSRDEDVAKLAASGMWFCPTLAVTWTIRDFVHNDGDFRQLHAYEYVSELDRLAWDDITAKRKAHLRRPAPNLEDEVRRARIFAAQSDNLLLGTDTPNPGVIAGFSVHDELDLMVTDLGLTPYAALRAGTVNAARSLGILDCTGTLEPGKDADLLMLSGNPLEDVRRTRDLDAVVKAGRLYDRAELDAILYGVRGLPVGGILQVWRP